MQEFNETQDKCMAINSCLDCNVFFSQAEREIQETFIPGGYLCTGDFGIVVGVQKYNSPFVATIRHIYRRLNAPISSAHCPISRTISITVIVDVPMWCLVLQRNVPRSMFLLLSHRRKLSQKITFTFFGRYAGWSMLLANSLDTYGRSLVVDRFPFKNTLKRTINRS